MHTLPAPSTAPHRLTPRRRLHGYSLIELLVVVGVVLALASVAWAHYGSVARDETNRLVQVQLDQLARAVHAFHADTGYWPGEGPFALAPAANSETLNADGSYSCSGDLSAGLVVRASLPDITLPSTVPDVDAWRAAWHAHPANLWQLFDAPVLCANAPLGRLGRWNDRAARGWHGPYLDPGKHLWVDMGSDSDFWESGNQQRNLYNLPAGYPRAPLDTCAADEHCTYRWWRKPGWQIDADDEATDFDYERLGRPVLYFGPRFGRPRIAHPGDDGRFGGLDASAPCLSASNDAGLDDEIRCLD